MPARAQVVLNTIANIDFGTIDFAATYSGRIQLATNGFVQTTGSGMIANSDGNAGVSRVTLPNTGILDVKCASTGLMVDPAATDLDIINVEIAINTGVAFGSGIACDGVGGGDGVVTTLDMDVLNDPDVLIGGEIVIPGVITLPPDRVYSSGGGGTPIRLSIVVQ